ncbi:MAG: chromate transporter [Bacteroidales bacterium]|nr:chromate transporter [Bacteroidales bacterium]
MAYTRRINYDGVKSYFSLFFSFFKIGCFTFGGGYAMIMMMQRELVDKKKWTSEEEFLNYLSLAQSSPGPMAINTAILIGYSRLKLRGAFAGFLGAVLPSFLILLGIAMFFSRIYQDPVVVSIFKGVRPAVAALILYPVFSFAKDLKYWEYPLLLAIGVAIYFSISPIWFIMGTILVAVLYVYHKTRTLKEPS